MGLLKLFLSGFTIIILLFSPEYFQAQETSVMVRVKARDAKFVGSSIGGAKIIVRDLDSGEILAEGFTKGQTGNTRKIMQEPVSRETRLSDEETAGFLAELKIEKPSLVSVEAFAPNDSKVKTETRIWVIPGKNIMGEGLVLEIPGFIVDILAPQRHERIGVDQEIEIRANVVMMCGCPVSSGGMWNADNYEIKALISKDGKPEYTLDMEGLEKASTFSGKIRLASGIHKITVYAFDPVSGNTGLAKTTIIVN